MGTVEQILRVFEDRGSEQYFGENVSQLEHALQSALLARRSGASESLVVAALLHDVGHLIHEAGEDSADHGIDARHEALGEAWLARHFGPEITEPIRLHVDAKRYLCAVEPKYLKQLSAASVQSLALQGGPMSFEQVRAFEANPHFRDAVTLRRFDDEAKVVGLVTPGLEAYRQLLAQFMNRLFTFSIRPALPADTPALTALIERSVRELQKHDYTPVQLDCALATVYGVDTQLVADGSYFVVEAAPGVLAGCGGWSKRKTLYGGDQCLGREDSLLNPATDAAKIRAFFVHPDWVRRGVGTLILETCENAAIQEGFTRFEMGATLTGVALYRARGYEELEPLSVPLANGDLFPIVRMAKDAGQSAAKRTE